MRRLSKNNILLSCTRRRIRTVTHKTLSLITTLSILLVFSAPLYANNTWSLVGDLNTPRAYHSATTFNGTQVLVAGGNSASVMISSNRETVSAIMGKLRKENIIEFSRKELRIYDENSLTDY